MDMKNRRQAVRYPALLVLSAILLFCACADREKGTLANPRERPVNEDIVLNEETWCTVRSELIEYWNDKTRFRKVDTSAGDVHTRVEFFVENNYWFAIILSRRNGAVGNYLPLVGWLRPPELGWRLIRGLDYDLDSLTMPEYLRLVEADSLWSLFGDYRFWQDTLVFQQIYWDADVMYQDDGTWWQHTKTHTIEAFESTGAPGLDSSTEF